MSVFTWSLQSWNPHHLMAFTWQILPPEAVLVSSWTLEMKILPCTAKDESISPFSFLLICLSLQICWQQLYWTALPGFRLLSKSANSCCSIPLLGWHFNPILPKTSIGPACTLLQSPEFETQNVIFSFRVVNVCDKYKVVPLICRTRVSIYIKYKDRTKDWLRNHSVCELESSYTIRTLLTESQSQMPKTNIIFLNISSFSTTINQVQTKKRKKEGWNFEEE